MKENSRNRGSLGGEMRMWVKEHCRNLSNHTKSNYMLMLIPPVVGFRFEYDKNKIFARNDGLSLRAKFVFEKFIIL